MDDSHGGKRLVMGALIVAAGLLVFSEYHRAVVAAWIGERIWRSPGPPPVRTNPAL